ncbi:MAG: hypothetical protein JWN22_690 [Nocardioides sp.]|jgi:uncharacterized protein (DUF305 family)|nr:hypothetical protein [Nocardioides sp.]
MKHAPRLAALVAAAALTLTACGGGDHSASSGATVPASAAFNDADVAFATDMIPHHAQALAMVDLTRGRDLDPAFERLSQQILDAQGPEIETMKGWLVDWDQPVPETSRDHLHADAGGMSMGAGDMPGMMSDQEMAGLDAAGDATFEDMWLRMMIRHHEGAIEMARTEQTDGEYADAVSLADDIETAQAHEITQMKAMLAG